MSRIITRLPGAPLVVKRYSESNFAPQLGESQAIEYSRTYHGEGLMRPGRLYYTYGRGTLGMADQEFCKWADSVMAATKRMMRYEKSQGGYLAPEAAGLIAEGKVQISWG